MIKLVFIFTLLLAMPAWASTSVSLGNNQKALIHLQSSSGSEAGFQVEVAGKIRQAFRGLGDKFSDLHFQGMKSSLVSLDLDKDGIQEFLVRTTQEPLVGALWVFRWDKEKKAFSHVLTATGDRYFPVPLEGMVNVAANGDISFEAPGGASVIYSWNGRAYVQKP
jgi:hypothetical protein